MITETAGSVRLENDAIGLRVDTARFSLQTIDNKLSGRTYEIYEPSPAVVALSRARQHVWVENWRMNLSSPLRAADHLSEPGYVAGYHRPETSDADWYEVELPYGTSYRRVRHVPDRYEGYGWFRREVDLPADGAGAPIGLVIGGYDQHDWSEYWIYLNGELIGHRLADSYWREPVAVEIAPDDPQYAALRFGHVNLIALQTCNLNRAVPGMRDNDNERYLFNGSLADQYLTIGPLPTRVSDFELEDLSHEQVADVGIIRARLRNRAEHLAVTVHYQIRGDEPTFRKWIEIENYGDSAQLALDVVVLDWQTSASSTLGGRGYPIYLDGQLFAALAHPAGINQGLGSRVRLWHCPGKQIGVGQKLTSRPAVVGAGEVDGAHAAFQAFLRRDGRRKPQPVAVWSTEGMHDYPFASTWEEQVVPEDKMLRALDWMEETERKHGKLFDYFVLDVGWQDHAGDLKSFHQDFWPSGPGKVVERVKQLDMRFGLWFSGTRASWSCGENPAVEPCFVPAPAHEKPEYRFVPETGPAARTSTSNRQLCPASEPYRSILREALLHHIRVNDLRFYKLDTSHYVCQSSSHDHLPGKYSTEAMVDEIIAITSAAQEACPDIFVMWYWGHSSPFWALYGDTIFECGVFMEASNVSTHPSLFYRDSVTTNMDEGTQFADQIPSTAKDSLGVWIGDVQWANWMGKDGWRDAWIADLGRGSLVAQLWGNVFLFDEDDARFLAETLAWFREHAAMLGSPIRVLGDPWLGEPYGNLHVGDRRAFLFAHNPTFEHRLASLTLDKSRGLPTAARWRVSRVYPDQVAFARREGYGEGEVLSWWLRPFEVALLQLEQLESASQVATDQPASSADPSEPPGNPARRLPFALSAMNGDTVGNRRLLSGRIDLPAIAEDSTVGVVLRFWKGGVHWRSDLAHELFDLTASVDGATASYTTVPAKRVWKASNWLLMKMDAPRAWAGKTIDVKLEAQLPGGVEMRHEAWLVPNWWTKSAYRSP